MRTYILTAFTLFIISCSPTYVRVYKTQPINAVSTDSTYKYENDSVLINYSFWYDRGIMAFSIYNKLSVPLYVDWKRSSFVSNIYKFNYWSDEVITKGRALTATTSGSYGGIFRYNGPLVVSFLAGSYTNSLSESVFVSKTVKPERITFIPPKSIIYKSTYYLTDKDYTDKSGALSTTEKRGDKPKKNTTILVKQFTKKNTPVVFRNFITISLSESFSNESYIDNEFYVSEIKFVDKRHFERWIFDSKGKSVYINNFMKGIDFYRIPSGLSVAN